MSRFRLDGQGRRQAQRRLPGAGCLRLSMTPTTPADLGFPIHSVPAAMPVFEGSLQSQQSDVERRAEALLVQQRLAELELERGGGEPGAAAGEEEEEEEEREQD